MGPSPILALIFLVFQKYPCFSPLTAWSLPWIDWVDRVVSHFFHFSVSSFFLVFPFLPPFDHLIILHFLFFRALLAIAFLYFLLGLSLCCLSFFNCSSPFSSLHLFRIFLSSILFLFSTSLSSFLSSSHLFSFFFSLAATSHLFLLILSLYFFVSSILQFFFFFLCSSFCSSLVFSSSSPISSFLISVFLQSFSHLLLQPAAPFFSISLISDFSFFGWVLSRRHDGAARRQHGLWDFVVVMADLCFGLIGDGLVIGVSMRMT